MRPHSGTPREKRTFGARLRDARREAGYSQGGLSVLSGVPKERISRYENGHVLPSLPIATRLAGLVGVKLDVLVVGIW